MKQRNVSNLFLRFGDNLREMRSKIFGLLAFAWVLAPAQEGVPASAYERTLHTPYLSQEDKRFGTAGEMYCAPVSAAMGISWLADHGYPNLLPRGENRLDSLEQAVMLLASKPYMNTNPDGGTGPGELIRGIERYVHDAGYQLADVSYAGWRSIPFRVSGHQVSPIPDFGLLRAALNQPSTLVLINLGHYHLQPNGDLKRSSGHWVLGVGYGTAGQEQSDDVILVHNPARAVPDDLASRTDLTKRLYYDVARLSPVSESLEDSSGRTIHSGPGMFSIDGMGVPRSRTVDANVVDDIVTLTLSSN